MEPPAAGQRLGRGETRGGARLHSAYPDNLSDAIRPDHGVGIKPPGQCLLNEFGRLAPGGLESLSLGVENSPEGGGNQGWFVGLIRQPLELIRSNAMNPYQRVSSTACPDKPAIVGNRLAAFPIHSLDLPNIHGRCSVWPRPTTYDESQTGSMVASVAVPEPSSLILGLVAAGIGWAGMRLRRCRSNEAGRGLDVGRRSRTIDRCPFCEERTHHLAPTTRRMTLLP